MLLPDSPPPAPGKRLYLRIATASLRAALESLLSLWRYTLLPEPAPGILQLVEEGLVPGVEQGPVLWLGGTPARGARLALPLVMEELWQALEGYFHRPPRNHLRIDIELAAEVAVQGSVYPTRLVSLSDAGGRFLFAAELPLGQALELQVTTGETPMTLEGRVIYACPRRRQEVEIGLVFHPRHRREKELLRAFIVASFLERVRRRLAAAGMADGLSHFARGAAGGF